MRNRYTQRVNGVLLSLIAAGYTPKLTKTKEMDVEDDTITVTDKVHVQIDSMSGDAVAVNRYDGEGKDFVMTSWDIDTDSKEALLKAVKEAIEAPVAV